MINGRVDPQSLRSKPPSSSPCLRNPSDGVYPSLPSPAPRPYFCVSADLCFRLLFCSCDVCVCVYFVFLLFMKFGFLSI